MSVRRAGLVLVDTGPLVALRNLRDQHHDRVLEHAKLLPEVLYTTWPVLTEACYLLKAYPAKLQGLLSDVRDGRLRLAPLGDDDADALAALMAKYQDQGFSLADASLMHVATRDAAEAIVTVDAKDFLVWQQGEQPGVEVIV